MSENTFFMSEDILPMSEDILPMSEDILPMSEDTFFMSEDTFFMSEECVTQLIMASMIGKTCQTFDQIKNFCQKISNIDDIAILLSLKNMESDMRVFNLNKEYSLIGNNLYKMLPCYYFNNGGCRHGKKCTYIHEENEYLMAKYLYKTVDHFKNGKSKAKFICMQQLYFSKREKSISSYRNPLQRITDNLEQDCTDMQNIINLHRDESDNCLNEHAELKKKYDDLIFINDSFRKNIKKLVFQRDEAYEYIEQLITERNESEDEIMSLSKTLQDARDKFYKFKLNLSEREKRKSKGKKRKSKGKKRKSKGKKRKSERGKRKSKRKRSIHDDYDGSYAKRQRLN